MKIDKDKLDYVYSGLCCHLMLAEKYLKAESEEDKEDFINNIKYETPEELLYGVLRSARDIYMFTRDKRFEKLADEAALIFYEMKERIGMVPVHHF